MEVVQVQPRDSYLHYIYVPTKGTAICWSFTTKRNNIGFGLYKRQGQTPLPSSSGIIFRAQNQQRQLSSPGAELFHNYDEDDKESCNDADSTGQSHFASSVRTRPRAKSIASTKLKEQGLEEILPIQDTNSSKTKVEGSLTVEDPGNYVLVFDNTFSRNTPKLLTFSVALEERNRRTSGAGHSQGISGWLLKKKRKRMQGWAKRWFHLSPSGVLSYSTSPTSVTRGCIQVLVSTISNTPKQRLIHIDTGTMLYHLKAITQEDHEMWTKALRSCKADTAEAIEDCLMVEEHSNLFLQAEQGVKGAGELFENFKKLCDSADKLHQLILEGSTEKNQLLGLSSQLIADKDMLSEIIGRQKNQWHSIWKAISPTMNNQQQRISGSIGETLDIQHSTVRRAASLNSGASVFSEQFFDAEDIVLSAEDDIVEEEVTVGDSTDEEGDSKLSGSRDDMVKTHFDNLMLKVETDEIFPSALHLDQVAECQRRSQLPSPAVGDMGSALSVFRKNVGKDLSTIAMPVSMNEPLSMLQRACEELEYSELLDKASTLSDPMERLMYVMVFAVSGYASSQYRSGRKPFNPMMTETYENIRPDKGFRFIAEKVSHNPLIIAEFMTEGTFHITLSGHDDHFTYSKPSSWLRNMIAGEKYLEHAGEMKVINHATGDYALVTFKEGTGGRLFGAPTNRNDVIAILFDAQGQKRRRVVGKWSEAMAEEVDMNKRQLSVLWNASGPGIEDHAKYYGFTRFAIELNEITAIEKDKLPKTDTRLRPDQRLYENGQVDEADEEKQRIEQKQRERRKELETSGVEWKPRWFELRPDPTESEQTNSWQFNGQYWKSRESGDWPSDLFDLW
ncbi:hypothetical protein EC973_008390 [Apophysomyces ossiformis]|uniref:PH domain-containing protein n=1 Tax=Apophysomyces ossiformis TaxID=679940 RepID=A0A8H7BTM0_9FUNG|nr:hypothetical protein EC973_008390 [Apophysomyces ossiformis]